MGSSKVDDLPKWATYSRVSIYGMQSISPKAQFRDPFLKTQILSAVLVAFQICNFHHYNAVFATAGYSRPG